MSGTNKTTEGFMTVDPSSVVVDNDALRQRRERLLTEHLEESFGIVVLDCDGPCGGISPRGDVSAPKIEQANTGSVGK